MDDQDIIAVMEAFGVGPHDFVRAQSSPQTLARFKERMKRQYRLLAHKLHPDKGGDPILFRAATAVMEDVMAMRTRDAFERRRMKWAVQIRMEVA